MDIDRQRIAAVRVLEAGGRWLPSAAVPPLPITAAADALHGALMRRADVLAVAQKARTKMR